MESERPLEDHERVSDDGLHQIVNGRAYDRAVYRSMALELLAARALSAAPEASGCKTCEALEAMLPHSNVSLREGDPGEVYLGTNKGRFFAATLALAVSAAAGRKEGK